MILEYERLEHARRLRRLSDWAQKNTYEYAHRAELAAGAFHRELDHLGDMSEEEYCRELDALPGYTEARRLRRLRREYHLAAGDIKYASRPEGANCVKMVDRFKEAEETALAEFIHAAEMRCRADIYNHD